MHSDYRIEVGYKNPKNDPASRKLLKQLREFGIPIKDVEIVKAFMIHANLGMYQVNKVANELFTDPIIQKNTINEPFTKSFAFLIEKNFRPGITDNEARTAKEQISLIIGRSFREDESVQTGIVYIFRNAKEKEVQKVASYISNPLIHRTVVYTKGRWPWISVGRPAPIEPKVELMDLDFALEGNIEKAVADSGKSYWEILNSEPSELKKLGLKKVKATDDHLKLLSKKMTLAMTADELKIFRDYFKNAQVQKKREELGLSLPTDVELEAFAQTQSEHCKHKIFNADITFNAGKNQKVIRSIFKTYIKGATDALLHKRKDLVSLFSDNAGIISFDANYNLCFKVETHNAPSALDPFGGAETGIVGVNRDVLGAGLGASPIANTDVFCLADPFYEGKLPPKVLHPFQIFEGVRAGVESGGNKSGIPTVNGAYFFDERFLGRPLVFCGTIGLMPKKIQGRDTSQKRASPGDFIVMVGGRIGKDGIHGATFSSAELDEHSPSAAVQIGDAITQKKMGDALLEARDLGLISSITDNGAGGLSSSIGEMAKDCGAELELSKAPLKYPGLMPWEILLSEAQERMSVAISSDNLNSFVDLMKRRNVEATVLGNFTDTGKFHVKYNGKTICYLDLKFLHDGLPKMKLEASLNYPVKKISKLPKAKSVESALVSILSDLNVCSKEYTIRQYDHEVKAQTIVKPLVGPQMDGPADASVLKPLSDSWKGIVVSNGLCPTISDYDSYQMALCAVDEAIRNAVCVGANPDSLVLLDNFCWPDPVFDKESNPDGQHKLAQLTESARGLYDAAIAFNAPYISGKDSMKNDFRYSDKGKNVKISIPPTILVSALGKMEDIRKAVTMDAKCAGDLVYVVGMTRNELLGSRFASKFDSSGSSYPKVDLKIAKETFSSVSKAIDEGFVMSCHDCSDGGLAVALAETAFSGGFGVEIDSSKIPSDNVKGTSLLFSESPSRFVVTISPSDKKQFEKILAGIPFSQVGLITKTQFFSVDKTKISMDKLKDAWKKPFGGRNAKG